jgi:lethal(2) giant larvae protein
MTAISSILKFPDFKYLGEKRSKETVSTQLAKEIQLKHKAPVVGIDIIDSNCCSLAENFNHPGKTLGEANAPHKVVISSEEQFKVIFREILTFLY